MVNFNHSYFKNNDYRELVFSAERLSDDQLEQRITEIFQNQQDNKNNNYAKRTISYIGQIFRFILYMIWEDGSKIQKQINKVETAFQRIKIKPATIKPSFIYPDIKMYFEHANDFRRKTKSKKFDDTLIDSLIQNFLPILFSKIDHEKNPCDRLFAFLFIVDGIKKMKKNMDRNVLALFNDKCEELKNAYINKLQEELKDAKNQKSIFDAIDTLNNKKDAENIRKWIITLLPEKTSKQ